MSDLCLASALPSPPSAITPSAIGEMQNLVKAEAAAIYIHSPLSSALHLLDPGFVSHYQCFLYVMPVSVCCNTAVCCHVTPTLTEWRVTRVTLCTLWHVWRIAPSLDTMSGYSILLNRFESKACRLQVYFLTH